MPRIARRDDPDGVRRVLADQLVEVDDPRGELIGLDLLVASGMATRAHTRRIRQIRVTHQHRLAGQIAPLMTRGGHRWDRGFLSHLHLHIDDAATVRQSFDSPLWNAVRSIRVVSCRAPDALAELLEVDAVREVPRLSGKLPDAILAEWFASSTRPLTHLDLPPQPIRRNDEERFVRRIVDGRGLPQLIHLGVPHIDLSKQAIDDLLATRPLTSVHLYAPLERFQALFDLFASTSTLKKLSFGDRLQTVTFHQNEHGTHLQLKSDLSRLQDGTRTVRTDLLWATHLDGLPTGSLAQVSTSIGGGYTPTGYAAKRLEATIHRVTATIG